jgi:hypothetical protein
VFGKKSILCLKSTHELQRKVTRLKCEVLIKSTCVKCKFTSAIEIITKAYSASLVFVYISVARKSYCEYKCKVSASVSSE